MGGQYAESGGLSEGKKRGLDLVGYEIRTFKQKPRELSEEKVELVLLHFWTTSIKTVLSTSKGIQSDLHVIHVL